MSTFSLAVRDSSTMLRRNLLHARRYPSLTLNLLLTPVMLLLLFVYIFGDTMSGGAGRSAYIAYAPESGSGDQNLAERSSLSQ
ncbi:hypothetical protein ACWEBX_41190, partial [Streptomyces sp. NPDC005070]